MSFSGAIDIRPGRNLHFWPLKFQKFKIYFSTLCHLTPNGSIMIVANFNFWKLIIDHKSNLRKQELYRRTQKLNNSITKISWKRLENIFGLRLSGNEEYGPDWSLHKLKNERMKGQNYERSLTFEDKRWRYLNKGGLRTFADIQISDDIL